MPWVMEALVPDRPGAVDLVRRERWRQVMTSDGRGYEYETFEQAASMLRMCYPDQLREERFSGKQTVRVVFQERILSAGQ